MRPGIAVRTDIETAAELRQRSQNEKQRRTALRMLAIANVLDGMNRTDAAREAGIERQSLCDAIKRYNAEGLVGLVDRPKGHRPERLTPAEQTVLIDHIRHGAGGESRRPDRWTLPELCDFVEARFNKTLAPQSMSRIVRRLDVSTQRQRPLDAKLGGAAADAAQAPGSMPAP